MVPAERLPDLCLLALFKQLTPEYQVIARKVCLRWHDLVPEATGRVRSLAIIIGPYSMDESANRIIKSDGDSRVMQYILKDDGTPMYPLYRFTEWNSLLIKTLDSESAHLIAGTFTSLSELKLATLEPNSLNWQWPTIMLETWRKQLTAAKLFIFGCNSASELAPFFVAVNSLSSLKHLTLDAYYTSCPLLPILSRLEEFVFISDLSFQSQLVQSFYEFAQSNESIRRVDLHINGRDIQYYCRLNERLRDRINFSCELYLPSDMLVPLTTRFVSLTSIYIESPPSFRSLFDDLSPLTQLVYLRLYIDFNDILPDQLDIPMAQLKSVKAVGLFLNVQSHKALSQLKLGWTTPNVQIIDILLDDDGGCSTCGIMNFAKLEASSDRYKRCVRQMCASWKRDCDQLRKILYEFNHELE